MLDPHRLRVFRSVVASGSIQAAAANLGYTPSAISQHVAALQRETGLTLLERSGRGVRPTSAGLALAAQADAVLARLSEAEAAVEDLRSGRIGTLSIAYFGSVGSAWLPHVVGRLLAEFPQLRLDLQLREEVPGIVEERADLQLVVDQPGRAPGSGFAAHHLLDDPYVAVLSERHRLAEAAEIPLPDLAAERWVDNDVARGWCRRQLLEACAAAGFSPSFHVEAHDYATAIAFVAAGIGITVLPALGAARLPPGLRAVPVVRPTPVRSIHVVVREAAGRTPPALAAIAALREVAVGRHASVVAR